MDFKQERERLKMLYLELLNLKLPRYSSSNILSDLIEELLEMDAYYAGIALSVSEGQKINKKELFDLKKIEKKINCIEEKNKSEIEIKKKCTDFFKKIQEIDFLVRRICFKIQS